MAIKSAQSDNTVRISNDPNVNNNGKRITEVYLLLYMHESHLDAKE